MTPDDHDRWEGLELLGYWALLIVMLAALLAFASGFLWLAGKVWRAVWPVVWPWVHANSDELTTGLGIAVVLALLLAFNVEGNRRR